MSAPGIWFGRAAAFRQGSPAAAGRRNVGATFSPAWKPGDPGKAAPAGFPSAWHLWGGRPGRSGAPVPPPPVGADTSLTAYLGSFGLRLGDVRPAQVPMFLVARKLARLVRELDIQVAGRPAGGEPLTLTVPQGLPGLPGHPEGVGGGVAGMPTDEVHLGFLRDTEELPGIFPEQWLMEEVAPDWFYAKLAARDLFLPQWQQEEPTGEAVSSPTGTGDLVPGHGKEDLRRQHAYLLLDVSGSMVDSDRRGTVARGLALAFVREGWRQGARLHLRPFATAVGDLLSGSSTAQFNKIVRQVISLENEGETALQDALEQAVADIRAGGRFARANIMLITDGVSRLGKSPLEGERLHCFVLGADQWCDGPVEHDTIRKLKQWSATWHRLRTDCFRHLIAPDARDLADLQTIFSPLSPESLAGSGLEALGDLAAAIDNTLCLEDLYQSIRGENDPEFSGLRRHLKALLRVVRESRGTNDRLSREGGRGIPVTVGPGGQSVAEQRQQGYDRGHDQRPGPEQQQQGQDPGGAVAALSMTGSGKPTPGSGMTFTELVRALWRSVCLVVARFLPRRAASPCRAMVQDVAPDPQEPRSPDR